MDEGSSSQFLYDSKKGAVISEEISGRYFVTPQSFLLIVIEEFMKVAGKGAPAILYLMGFEDGKKIGQEISNRLESEFQTKEEETLSFTSGSFGIELGKLVNFQKWAEVSEFNVDFDNKRADIKLLDHVFSRNREGKGESYCDWIRGWVAGMFTVIFNETVVCREKKCKAYGDPYCEFIIGRKEEILFE